MLVCKEEWKISVAYLRKLVFWLWQMDAADVVLCGLLSSCSAFRDAPLWLPMQRGLLWFSGFLCHMVLYCSLLLFHTGKRCCEQVCPRIICLLTETTALSKSTLCVWFLPEQCRCHGCSSIHLYCVHILDFIPEDKKYANYCDLNRCQLAVYIECTYCCAWKQIKRKDRSTIQIATASVKGQPQWR